MRAIPTNLHIARHLLETDKAWLLFVEVPSRAVEDGFFRLVRNTEAVIAGGRGWLPTQMDIELPEETADGGLAKLVITIPNVSRIPLALVETDVEGAVDEGDLLGQTATVWLAHESDLSVLPDALSWKHIITEAVCTEMAARFTCGHAAGLRGARGPRFTRANFPQLLASAGQGVVRVAA